jgi:hypothetical protein
MAGLSDNDIDETAVTPTKGGSNRIKRTKSFRIKTPSRQLSLENPSVEPIAEYPDEGGALTETIQPILDQEDEACVDMCYMGSQVPMPV